MNKTIQFRAHPDGDWMSMGVSFVDASSFTVPDGMELDARGGKMRWTAAERDFDKREINFDYFAPEEVTVVADKSQIQADGVEEVELTVTSEGAVPIAIIDEDGDKLGSFDVDGTATRTISVAGTYTYRVDLDVLEPTWNVSLYRDAGSAVVEAV